MNKMPENKIFFLEKTKFFFLIILKECYNIQVDDK